MHDGETKPFEEMSRDELIAAARFWQSEYERVVSQGALTMWPKCGNCGCNHSPTVTCAALPGGGALLQFGVGR